MNNNTQLENSWNTATLKSNKITKPEANSFRYNVVHPDRNVNIDSDVFHYVFQWKRHFLGGQIDKIGNTIFPNGREKYSTGRESDKLEGKNAQLEIKVQEQENILISLLGQTNQSESDLKLLPNNRQNAIQSSGKSGIPRTCRELRATDPSLPSGMHWIDPDGQGIGDDPIYVYCDMTSGTNLV
jgi:hypothetical protein